MGCRLLADGALMTEIHPGESVADHYFTTEQLASLLQRSERTLETWRRNGNGPPFLRLGRRVVYGRPDIELWLTSKRFKNRAHELSVRDHSKNLLRTYKQQ